MAFWTDTFLGKRRSEWLEKITSAQYCVGGVWYDATITSKAVNGDTITIIVNLTGMPAGNQTITAVRLIDEGGTVAGVKTDSITKTGTQGILLRFDYPIKEV